MVFIEKAIQLLISFGLPLVLSFLSTWIYSYICKGTAYEIDSSREFLRYFLQQSILLIPLFIALYMRKNIAATIFIAGFLIGNILYLNTIAEKEPTERGFFDVMGMLSVILASYLVGIIGQFIYNFYRK